MAKVSVIIPMYNAKRYILSCVDSLLNQTIGDVEIVVVNDCSTDDSMEICKAHYEGNERVMLIDQPRNMGPGRARNAGIERATGEYLAFVDADDGLLPNALSDMYEAAVKYDADVLHVGGALIPYADELPDDLNIMQKNQLIKLPLDSGAPKGDDSYLVTEDMKERVDNWMKHAYHWNVWAKLCRTSFIKEHDIKFPDLPLSEDQSFCFRCLVHAKNYAVMPGNYYIYRIAVDSISRGKKTPAFLAKALRAQLGVSDVILKAMDAVPFFTEYPEYRKKVVDYCLECLEDNYVRQAYQELDRNELEKDEIVQAVFRTFFGTNARYVFNLFCDHHDALPKIDDLMGQMNTGKFWRDLVEKGMAEFLEK